MGPDEWRYVVEDVKKQRDANKGVYHQEKADATKVWHNHTGSLT